MGKEAGWIVTSVLFITTHLVSRLEWNSFNQFSYLIFDWFSFFFQTGWCVELGTELLIDESWLTEVVCLFLIFPDWLIRLTQMSRVQRFKLSGERIVLHSRCQRWEMKRCTDFGRRSCRPLFTAFWALNFLQLSYSMDPKFIVGYKPTTRVYYLLYSYLFYFVISKPENQVVGLTDFFNEISRFSVVYSLQ